MLQEEKPNNTGFLNRLGKILGLSSGSDSTLNDNIVLSHYEQPSDECTFKDLGIDENKLFEKVARIEGDAKFYRSNLKNIGNLESIGEYAYIASSLLKEEDFKGIKVGKYIYNF